MTKIGIVCGLAFEATIVERATRRMPVDQSPLAVYSGPGPKRSQAAVNKLIEHGAEAIMSFGIAGGLDPNLQTGMVFSATSFTGPESPPCDTAWGSKLKAALQPNFIVHSGSMAGAADVVRTVAEKSALFQESGASAVDMESYGAAEAAAGKGLPFTVLRVICDTAGETIPPVAADAMTWEGRIRVTSTVLGALMHPKQIPDLVRLGQRTAQAKSVLEKLAGFCADRSLFF